MNIHDAVSRIERLWGRKGTFLALSVLLLVFVLGTWGATWLVRQVRVGALWRQGSAALSASDFPKALRAYRAAFEVDNRNTHVLAALLNTAAMARNRTGTAFAGVPEASAYVERALSQSEGDKELLEAVGYFLEAQKEYSRAVLFYEKALALDEKDAKLWFHLGHANEFLGNTGRSMEAYEKAYALDPENPLMLIAKANAARGLNNMEDAYELFMRAVDASDEAYLQAEALSVASAIRRYQGELKEAKELAERALAADPGYAPAKVNYGMVVAMEGDIVRAVDAVYEAIQINPAASQGYWAMGVILRNNGYFNEGIEYFNAGIARIRGDVSLVGPQAKQRASDLFLRDIAATRDLLKK